MTVAAVAAPSFVQLYTPKLVTTLKEGYGLAALKADAIAGLTVAIVAIPLSMAIAIASGVGPERGLYTAIIGGFLISLLGGSRFQIGGPAGAFIVLVSGTVARYGVDGLILATMMAGVILLAAGLLRLGTFIKYIPYPVTVGFTAGIAVIISTSQLKELLGLRLAGAEPGPIIPKVEALFLALPTVDSASVIIGVAAILLIAVLRRLRPHWPGFLIAVVLAAVVAAALGLHVATIGSRFGGIPRTLPMPHLPALSLEKMRDLLPEAFAFALLGSIESLLSAVVADSMTGRRHRSNCELVAQGVANIASALFGGICVTGAIARTATNVRAGARGPVAGMLHAAFLLLFLGVAAPLASYIPLSALAGVLAVVAWNMAGLHEVRILVRASRGDAIVLLSTLGLTIFRDLTTGIAAGFGIGTLLFLRRMSQSVEIETGQPMTGDDRADGEEDKSPYDAAMATDPDVVVYRISGAFFFGAAATVAAGLDQLSGHPKAYVIDFSAVPVIDSTAAATIEGFLRKAERQGVRVYISGAQRPIRHTLLTQGVRPPRVRYKTTIADAIASAHAKAIVEPEVAPA
jgi:SulP family sulfate permease